MTAAVADGARAPQTWSVTVARSFLTNQAIANAGIAEALGGAAASVAGAELAQSRSVIPYYNQAVLTAPVLDAADAVWNEIDGFFTGGPPATVLSAWPTPDLAARGWALVGHPAFVVGKEPFERRPPRPDVTVRRVETAADLAATERVIVEGYPVPEAVGLPMHSVLGTELLEGPVTYWLGLLDGEPVAAAGSHVGEGLVNLCVAATLPAARRRGVWEAMVLARVDEAHDLPAAAFTSDYSRPGFVRLGFLSVTRFTLWLIP